MANILVYALHYEGAINKNSLGAVSEGADLAAIVAWRSRPVIAALAWTAMMAAGLASITMVDWV